MERLKIEKKMPTLSIHTHCQVAQKAHRTSQNLSKSMAAPTLLKRKHGHTTKAIRNAGKVLNMNIIETNKINSKLKMKSF